MMDSQDFIFLIKDIVKQEIQPSYKLGTVTGGKVVFDGEDTASGKTYKKLNSITLADNDRVLLARVSSTYVILGKLT
ncbi:hypothetical protein HZI73_22320 [Vallitalea pronyensis]|uniref:Uncharacterized protein n=1 Tax=Vallitalea pronyensis TaxID=1348613 RepID=A0A8J8SIW4_9FIRM|nr:hypothetical protein [Vallitalea pronyensis]QUI24867.1 hypothetical protein HZI73_22320 [Vallitalea pronyensis]